MLFQTLHFFLFFSLFFIAYKALSKRLTAQNLLILLASYYFYGVWDVKFLSLIIISTAVDFICGIGASGEKLKKTELRSTLLLAIPGIIFTLATTLPDNPIYLTTALIFILTLTTISLYINSLKDAAKRKKLFVTLSISTNLGILCIFKYFNFFAQSMADLASYAGVELSWTTLNIVLPVGISFYTFQTLSYTIDCYRGALKPSRDIIQFSSFVSFFPQLVAGPVERASNLLPQFAAPRKITRSGIESGSYLFLWGLFKKVVIADNIAPISNMYFNSPSNLSGEEVLIGVLAFTFQIYCDFSGYSDMARGSARIVDFNLMLNFNLPYISKTPSEFWQRWHISLSSWLRDYLYISLGGNKRGKLLTYRNLFLTMLLGGLWHGANWTFIAWGSFHGAILILYRLLSIDELLSKTTETPLVARKGIKIILWLVMFSLTLYGWLIFRSNDINSLIEMTKSLFDFSGKLPIEDLSNLLYSISPLLLYQTVQILRRDLEPISTATTFIKLNAVLFLLLSVMFLQPAAPSAFIYFDF